MGKRKVQIDSIPDDEINEMSPEEREKHFVEVNTEEKESKKK